MSILSIVNNVVELMIIVSLISLIVMMRRMLSENPTIRSLKTKKYLGYIMIAVCCIGVMDYSFVTYRLFVPANPLEIIAVDNHEIVKELAECDNYNKDRRTPRY